MGENQTYNQGTLIGLWELNPQLSLWEVNTWC